MVVKHGSITERKVHRFANGSLVETKDLVTTEAPLEIVLRHGSTGQRQTTALAVTMRTPGEDRALATGYLYTEGIIDHAASIVQFRQVEANKVVLELAPDILLNPAVLDRNTFVHSGCGLCGKKDASQIETITPYLLPKAMSTIDMHDLRTWPALLEKEQLTFQRSGGSHAVGLIYEHQLFGLAEDVGRHNAMDKLIGAQLLQPTCTLGQSAVIVSGRASFELVQKALVAGIPTLVSIGPPSSMAIELAEEHQMTLIGFARADRFNVYSGVQRLKINGNSSFI